MKRTTLLFLLAIALLLAPLAGCAGGGEAPASPASDAGGQSAAESAAEPVVAEDGREMVGNMYVEGLPILKETETFTIANARDANSKNSYAEKAAVIEMEKQTNVHIEWLETPASGWDDKVNIMLASGDLPDAFSFEVKEVMRNSSLFVTLDEYVETYAPNIMEMFTAQPELRAGSTAPDGKLYALPTNRMDDANLVDPGLWVNTQWLEALNLEMPTTLAEFEAMLIAFRDQDPNGNGAADEIPFGAFYEPNNTTNNLDPMFGAFGVMDTQEYVYGQDGKVFFGGREEGYFKALQWLNKLYGERLIDQELFTMAGTQFTSKAQDPAILYGVMMCWLPDGYVTEYFDVYKNMPPLVGDNGEQMWVKARTPAGNSAGFTITTACEAPEVLIRYFDNNIATLENIMLWFNGPEGEGIWKYDADGVRWHETAEYLPEGANMGEFERTVAVGPYSPARMWNKYNDLRVQEPRMISKIEVNKMYLQYAVNAMPRGLEDPDLAGERALLFADIDTYMKQFKANSIVEGITEEQWQTHLETLASYNVDQYVSLWQSFYDTKQ